MKKFIPWKEFKAFYRGKEKDHAEPLDTASIRQWSFMTRSFFGRQGGGFSLKIRYVCAFAEKETRGSDERMGAEKDGNAAAVLGGLDND